MASNISSSSEILAQTTQPAFSSSLMDDTNPKSPYFLPSVDNAGIILVSQPLLGPENYSTWARAIFLSLSGRNKFGFVNGSFPMPDFSSPLLDAWNRANTSILSWLTNSLSKDIAASVMYINTTRDLWIDMRDRFSQGNAPRFFEVQKEISKLSQGQLSVSSYFTRFKILWDKLVNYQSFSIYTCTCICGS